MSNQPSQQELDEKYNSDEEEQTPTGLDLLQDVIEQGHEVAGSGTTEEGEPEEGMEGLPPAPPGFQWELQPLPLQSSSSSSLLLPLSTVASVPSAQVASSPRLLQPASTRGGSGTVITSSSSRVQPPIPGLVDAEINQDRNGSSQRSLSGQPPPPLPMQSPSRIDRSGVISGSGIEQQHQLHRTPTNSYRSQLQFPPASPMNQTSPPSGSFKLTSSSTSAVPSLFQSELGSSVPESGVNQFNSSSSGSRFTSLPFSSSSSGLGTGPSRPPSSSFGTGLGSDATGAEASSSSSSSSSSLEQSICPPRIPDMVERNSGRVERGGALPPPSSNVIRWIIPGQAPALTAQSFIYSYVYNYGPLLRGMMNDFKTGTYIYKDEQMHDVVIHYFDHREVGIVPLDGSAVVKSELNNKRFTYWYQQLRSGELGLVRQLAEHDIRTRNVLRNVSCTVRSVIAEQSYPTYNGEGSLVYPGFLALNAENTSVTRWKYFKHPTLTSLVVPIVNCLKLNSFTEQKLRYNVSGSLGLLYTNYLMIVGHFAGKVFNLPYHTSPFAYFVGIHYYLTKELWKAIQVYDPTNRRKISSTMDAYPEIVEQLARKLVNHFLYNGTEHTSFLRELQRAETVSHLHRNRNYLDQDGNLLDRADTVSDFPYKPTACTEFMIHFFRAILADYLERIAVQEQALCTSTFSHDLITKHVISSVVVFTDGEVIYENNASRMRNMAGLIWSWAMPTVYDRNYWNPSELSQDRDPSQCFGNTEAIDRNTTPPSQSNQQFYDPYTTAYSSSWNQTTPKSPKSPKSPKRMKRVRIHEETIDCKEPVPLLNSYDEAVALLRELDSDASVQGIGGSDRRSLSLSSSSPSSSSPSNSNNGSDNGGSGSVLGTLAAFNTLNGNGNRHINQARFDNSAIRDLADYSGEENDPNYPTASEFVDKFEEKIRFYSTDSKVKIDAFGMKLKGIAKIWFDQLNESKKLSWIDFRECFFQECCPAHSRTHSREAFFKIAQGPHDTIPVFYAKLVEMQSKANRAALMAASQDIQRNAWKAKKRIDELREFYLGNPNLEKSVLEQLTQEMDKMTAAYKLCVQQAPNYISDTDVKNQFRAHCKSKLSADINYSIDRYNKLTITELVKAVTDKESLYRAKSEAAGKDLNIDAPAVDSIAARTAAKLKKQQEAIAREIQTLKKRGLAAIAGLEENGENAEKKFKGTCFKCHKAGHKKSECLGKIAAFGASGDTAASVSEVLNPPDYSFEKETVLEFGKAMDLNIPGLIADRYLFRINLDSCATTNVMAEHIWNMFTEEQQKAMQFYPRKGNSQFKLVLITPDKNIEPIGVAMRVPVRLGNSQAFGRVAIWMSFWIVRNLNYDVLIGFRAWYKLIKSIDLVNERVILDDAEKSTYVKFNRLGTKFSREVEDKVNTQLKEKIKSLMDMKENLSFRRAMPNLKFIRATSEQREASRQRMLNRAAGEEQEVEESETDVGESLYPDDSSTPSQLRSLGLSAPTPPGWVAPSSSSSNGTPPSSSSSITSSPSSSSSARPAATASTTSNTSSKAGKETQKQKVARLQKKAREDAKKEKEAEAKAKKDREAKAEKAAEGKKEQRQIPLSINPPLHAATARETRSSARLAPTTSHADTVAGLVGAFGSSDQNVDLNDGMENNVEYQDMDDVYSASQL